MYSRESLELRNGEFLRPRLHGARFEDGSVSLEILGELAALRELVIEVARWRFLKENPSRQRSPRWFNKIDLKLTGISRGSAVPVISLVPDERFFGARPLWYHRFYERAREDIVDAIGAAESNDSQLHSKGHFPSHFLTHFNRIGRSLRDGEYIEFVTPARRDPVRLTKQSRLRLLDWSSEFEGSEALDLSDVTFRGVISEADLARMTFELQPVYGPKISGPIPVEYLETVMTAFNRYERRERVMVEGAGHINWSSRTSSLESVVRITRLNPLDVPARLDEFRHLKDGWLEGDGRAPDHAGLDWLSDSFERHYPEDIPLPHTYPTPEGGVEMEWSFGSQSVILEIDLEKRHGDWLRFDKESDEEDSFELAMHDDAAWDRIVAEVRRLSELHE